MRALTVPVDRDKLLALRKRNALTQEKLAQESGIGKKTIERMETGGRVSLATIRILAKFFEVDPNSLLVTECSGGSINTWSGQVTLAAIGAEEYDFELTLDEEDFALWDPAKQEKFLKALRLLLGLVRAVRVVRLRGGSVKITIRLNAEDAERLVTAFELDKLLPLGVSSVDEIESDTALISTSDKSSLETTASAPIELWISTDGTFHRHSKPKGNESPEEAELLLNRDRLRMGAELILRIIDRNNSGYNASLIHRAFVGYGCAIADPVNGEPCMIAADPPSLAFPSGAYYLRRASVLWSDEPSNAVRVQSLRSLLPFKLIRWHSGHEWW